MAEHQDRTSLASARPAVLYEGWVARTHDGEHPLVYSHGPEYRDAEELQNIFQQVQACDGIQGRNALPTTLLHPEGLIRFGAEARAVGHIIGGYLDGDHVVAQFVVWDPEALNAIDGGVHELSLGYTAKLDDASYQRDITLDHLAIVPKGRCGTCELNPYRVDSGEELGYRRDLGGELRLASFVPSRITAESMTAPVVNVSIDPEAIRSALKSLVEAATQKTDSAPAETPHEDCTCKIRANVVDNEAQAMDELKKQLDEAVKALDESKTKIASLEADLKVAKDAADRAKTDGEIATEKMSSKHDVEKERADRLAAEVETLKKEIETLTASKANTDAADFAKAVDARVDLLATAARCDLSDAKSMSDRDIKVAIVKKVRNKDLAEEKDTSKLDAYYEIAVEQLDQAEASNAAVRGAVEQHKEEAATASNTKINEEAERQASVKRRDERFNKPVAYPKTAPDRT